MCRWVSRLRLFVFLLGFVPVLNSKLHLNWTTGDECSIGILKLQDFGLHPCNVEERCKPGLPCCLS